MQERKASTAWLVEGHDRMWHNILKMYGAHRLCLINTEYMGNTLVSKQNILGPWLWTCGGISQNVLVIMFTKTHYPSSAVLLVK